MWSVFGDNIRNSRNANSGKLLIKPNKRLNSKKKHLNRSLKRQNDLSESVSNTSERLIVKQKTIRILVLLDTGSSGDLLLIRKGSQKYIPTMKRAVPQSWGTSNGTLQTKRVGVIDISFMEYSASKVGKTDPWHCWVRSRSSSTFVRPNHRQANFARYRCGPGL